MSTHHSWNGHDYLLITEIIIIDNIVTFPLFLDDKIVQTNIKCFFVALFYYFVKFQSQIFQIPVLTFKESKTYDITLWKILQKKT